MLPINRTTEAMSSPRSCFSFISITVKLLFTFLLEFQQSLQVLKGHDQTENIPEQKNEMHPFLSPGINKNIQGKESNGKYQVNGK
jgi:hypothetical protein